MDRAVRDKFVDSLPIGYALEQIVYDADNNPVDFIFLQYNKQFESMFNLDQQSILERPSKTIQSGYNYHDINWIELFVNVVNSQQPIEIEYHEKNKNRYFKVQIDPQEEKCFSVFVTDITKVKREALQKIMFLTTLNDLVFCMNDQNIVEEVLTSNEALLYVPKEKFLGKNVMEVFDSELQQHFLTFIERVKKTRTKQSFEYSLVIGNQEKWFRITGDYVPIGDENKLITSVMDITEQHELHEKLLEQTQSLESFFTISLELLCIADNEGRFIKVNSAWEALLGYPLQDILGSRYMSFVHPDDYVITQEAIKLLKEGNPVEGFVNRYRTINGDYKYLEWAANSFGKLTYAAARDITKRIEMERQLIDSKEQFELAVKGSNDGIWDWNILNNELFMSDKFKEQLGLELTKTVDSFENYIGRIHPDDRQTVNQHLHSYLNMNGDYYDQQFRMLHSNGEYRWIRARGIAMRDGENVAYRMAGSHTDITEQKKAEEEILYLS